MIGKEFIPYKISENSLISNSGKGNIKAISNIRFTL